MQRQQGGPRCLTHDERGEHHHRQRAEAEGVRSAPAGPARLDDGVARRSMSPAVTSSAPGASRSGAQPEPGQSAGSTRRARASAARPIGRLMRKIQFQPAAWVSTPPRTEPRDAPGSADEAAHARVPAPVRGAPGTEHDDHARGPPPRPSPPPTPCRNRAVTSVAASGATPHSSGRRGEHGEARDEHPLAPDQVAEPPEQQQQPAERDQVRVHHPGEARGAENPRSSWMAGSATARCSRPG